MHLWHITKNRPLRAVMTRQGWPVPGLPVPLQRATAKTRSLPRHHHQTHWWSFAGVFCNQAGLQVGLIHRIGPGQKATCKVHADCVCWVSRQADSQELGSALKGWLREMASAEPPTAAQHAASAYRLKVAFGMRPRKLPGV